MPGLNKSPLDILEQNITEIEKKLVGAANVSQELALADSLVDSTVQLDEACQKWPGINSVWRQMSRIVAYLDPTFEDSLVDMTAKADLLLELMPEMRRDAALLNRIQELERTALAGKVFEDPSGASERLRLLSERVSKAEKKIKELEATVKRVVESYSTVMKTINRAIVTFNANLTELEEQENTRKPDEDI